ncbi:MAG: type I polyketide synthase, partial [Blastocatellia bacterium]
MDTPDSADRFNGSEIAVIGLTCRFPGARNVDDFWQTLRDGIECVSFLKDDELEASIVDPAEPSDPNYVKAAAILADADLFDASFFGFTPKEAEVMDPQHRLFLESAWEVLENGGYDPETYGGSIGVFAGARTNTYLFNLFSNSDKVGSLGAFEIGLGNDLAFLPTRVSYKLNLRGPSYAVHTACSTSLVAIHLACQSLLIDECQMALAGGVAVNIPQKTGYLYTRGGISSPDGHCRAFDARAQGTLFGSGVGIVLLKRLEDALADGDTIHAIIKGTAANNDGSAKASFTAPSVIGQTEVVAEALANAGVEPETISYVETHGTGTALGDPIEIRGLTKAFDLSRTRQSCALGSVKTNLGHLDAAAGIASFIKATLAIKHGQLPPSLHFKEPNPNISFDGGPFYVNAELTEWKPAGYPRRAGVSSFGVGGTNVHVVLEEAPQVEESQQSRPWQLLLLSARSPVALEAATANLADFLKQHPDINLPDVAYTLKVGRRPFSHRRMLVCRDVDEACEALETLKPQSVATDIQETTDRPVAFMFPGGGAQYANMGFDLYQSEPLFRNHVDECCEMLKPQLGYDLRQFLFPPANLATEASERLKQTSTALPALFIVEYALAKLWMSWGVRPDAMIGHSLGEYVAACLAGVFSLRDGLSLVVLRAKLFERLPRGSMLSVSLPESAAAELLDKELSIAAINGPDQCVFSGPVEAIDEMAVRLGQKEIEFRRIHIDVAAHSNMVDRILDEFRGFVRTLRLRPPQIPFISNVTGDWIGDAEATDPDYWTRHLRQTVRFALGLKQLMKEPARVMLEVGPGQTLSTLAKLQGEPARGRTILSSIRHPYERQSDEAFLLATLGKLWLAGVEIDWKGFHADERRRRLPLPTYPFERQRYWIEPRSRPAGVNGLVSSGKKTDVAEWFYIPSWKLSAPTSISNNGANADELRRWLIFADESSFGRAFSQRLMSESGEIMMVKMGDRFSRSEDGAYTINPSNPDDFDSLLKELKAIDKAPDDIIHLWSVTGEGASQSSMDSFNRAQTTGFYSLLYLAQAIGRQALSDPLQLWVLTDKLHEVESHDASLPEKATMLGPCKVIPQEFQNVTSHCIDLLMAEPGTRKEERLLNQLVADLVGRTKDVMVAYRGGRRWAQTFEPMRLEAAVQPARSLRKNGVYLITGGLGGVGLLLAEHLAQTVQARLILTGRSSFLERSEWEGWLAAHEDDDEISRKVRTIMAIEEAAGAQVFIASADVADEAQMQRLVERIYDQYGELNGVI